MIDENALNIYTDGSSYARPRRGGVGILFVWVDSSGNEITEPLNLPGFAGASNNKMELMACICALKESASYTDKRNFSRILIHTDSQYVKENYQNAKFDWPKSRWHTRSGSPVANAHLWKDLIKAARKVGMPVCFRKVKGHSKDRYNGVVDKLAKQSAGLPINKPVSSVTVRRKLSPKTTVPGSVRMLGQRLTIRIITSEYMQVQQTNKYRYEVMSKHSQYYKSIDFLYSSIPLKPGHIYSVRLNRDSGNPGILKVFKEVVVPAKETHKASSKY